MHNTKGQIRRKHMKKNHFELKNYVMATGVFDMLPSK